MADQLVGALGLAVRAGACLTRLEACKKAIHQGKARLVLIDPSASQNTAKEVRLLCERTGTPLMVLPEMGMAEHAGGRTNGRVLVVLDSGFAAMVRKHMV
jgi:ribosomal protein L7Ae-like RNA K-turn-binding protein